MISIHDPIHGTIEVTPQEIKLIDSRVFQRLRFIKQLGFSEMAFPRRHPQPLCPQLGGHANGHPHD